MEWIMRKEFEIAFEKANLILSKLAYTHDQDEMIRTADIIAAVEKELNLDIKFQTYNFKKFSNSDTNKSLNFESFGAAMCVSNENNNRRAIILLNEKESLKMQRFSLVHEMGHLMLDNFENIEGYKLSTHINMELTSIPDEIFDNKEYEFLIEEQQANIFALLVLIPYDMLISAAKKAESFDEIANFFGVEKNAIVSRMELEGKLKEKNGE